MKITRKYSCMFIAYVYNACIALQSPSPLGRD